MYRKSDNITPDRDAFRTWLAINKTMIIWEYAQTGSRNYSKNGTWFVLERAKIDSKQIGTGTKENYALRSRLCIELVITKLNAWHPKKTSSKQSRNSMMRIMPLSIPDSKDHDFKFRGARSSFVCICGAQEIMTFISSSYPCESGVWM